MDQTYPLNVTKPHDLAGKGSVGHAVASNDTEHKALTEQGYLPAFSAKEAPSSKPTREELEQNATALGVKFDGRTLDAKLLEMTVAAADASKKG